MKILMVAIFCVDFNAAQVCFRHEHRMSTRLILQELEMNLKPSGLMHLSCFISVNFCVCELLSCIPGLARIIKFADLF